MARERLIAIALVLLAGSAPRAEPTLLETTLPLHLVGTVVNAESQRSIAVIDSAGSIRVVRVGDEIGGAEVAEVRKDEVVLARSGRRERLAFATASAASRSGSAGGVAALAAQGDDDADTRDAVDPDHRAARLHARVRARPGARVRRARAVPASAAPADDADDGATTQVASSEQLLLTLSGQARYAPLLDDSGQLRGVALLDVRPDSTLERIGLRSGDVVTSVAGVRVENTPGAFNALRGLDPRAGGEVVVERQGVPTRIVVPPGAL